MSKLLISFVAMAVFAGQTMAQVPHHPGTLELVKNEQVVPFDGPKQVTLKFWLQQLMLSALYRDVVEDSSLDEWQQQLSVATRVHCRYSPPANLAIPERQALSFDEVMLPLPADQFPSYVFIKRGDQIHRLAKYDPWVLRKLLSEAGLLLYPGLSGVERALF